jgi:hypothetical protein
MTTKARILRPSTQRALVALALVAFLPNVFALGATPKATTLPVDDSGFRFLAQLDAQDLTPYEMLQAAAAAYEPRPGCSAPLLVVGEVPDRALDVEQCTSMERVGLVATQLLPTYERTGAQGLELNLQVGGSANGLAMAFIWTDAGEALAVLAVGGQQIIIFGADDAYDRYTDNTIAASSGGGLGSPDVYSYGDPEGVVANNPAASLPGDVARTSCSPSEVGVETSAPDPGWLDDSGSGISASSVYGRGWGEGVCIFASV